MLVATGVKCKLGFLERNHKRPANPRQRKRRERKGSRRFDAGISRRVAGPTRKGVGPGGLRCPAGAWFPGGLWVANQRSRFAVATKERGELWLEATPACSA